MAGMDVRRLMVVVIYSNYNAIETSYDGHMMDEK
jgi:hypothetical protein